MEVVALVPARDHASARYRVRQFRRHLEAKEMTLRIEPLASEVRPRLVQLARSAAADVIVLQRKLLPISQLLLLRQAARVLLYDFDDAVYLRDSFHTRGPYSLTRWLRFHATVALSDLVFAGNRYLADHVTSLVGARKVHVVPTCVDAAKYPPATHADRSPTLVWIGSSSTMRWLDEGRKVLEAVGRELPQARLKVICDRCPRFEHLPVEHAAWSSRTEPAQLRDADIGISWMPDDGWSRGKCGLKVLQYMAAGLPVVASPVGVHRTMIGERAGLLPVNERQWVDAVRLLAADPALRQRMGTAGRDAVRRDYDLGTWGPAVADLLHQAAA